MIKQEIIKRLNTAKAEKELCEAIAKVKKDYEHYKHVDKRFVDGLVAAGLRAWQYRDDNKHSITVCKQTPDGEVKIYMRACYEKLTWERIDYELSRYGKDEEIARYEAELVSYDADIQKVKELVATMRSLTVGSFSSALDRAINEITNYGSYFQ